MYYKIEQNDGENRANIAIFDIDCENVELELIDVIKNNKLKIKNMVSIGDSNNIGRSLIFIEDIDIYLYKFKKENKSEINFVSDLFNSDKLKELIELFIIKINESEIKKEIEDVVFNGIKRNLYPDNVKNSMVCRGKNAKNNWNNPIFTLGMEYGYIYKLLKDNDLLLKDEIR